MEIIEALSKLSFSFWQIVILILAFNFRREIKSLLDRISSITLLNTGIELSNGSEIVPELKALKGEIQKRNSSTENQCH